MSDESRTNVHEVGRTPRVVVRAATDVTPPQMGEIAVWVVPLDTPPASPEQLFENLTPEERDRANRYKVAKPRHQFVVGRGLLRQLLGGCLGVPPCEVPIAYSGAGKPQLAESGCGLHFNVTHTDGLALLALATRPLGIDVERVRAVSDATGLVRRFFSAAEQAAYLALTEELRPAGFFRAWTCKEALIKAVGLSVLALDEFDVELNPANPAALLGSRHVALMGANWELAAWEPAAGFAAAVATKS